METISPFAGTIWAILPPVLAIGLALITKEVYFSLLLGIFSGALLWTGGQILPAIETSFSLMADKVGGNFFIVVFLVLLGMLVALMSKSGATKAYGNWASKSIKSKRGASLATVALGCLIFVDDYFNCLTVGTVMSPVTDRHKITRAKLAYLIDATAAPVCIIAPVSSWAAAVSSSLPENCGIDGFTLFLRTIPFNLYAILTILMLLFISIGNFDFSKMEAYIKKHESEPEILTGVAAEESAANGKVYDLLIPIISLIVLCIAAMLYTGGLFSGEAGFVEAFANCSAPESLVYGAIGALVVTALLYLPRRIVKFTEFTGTLAEGCRAMIPAILILSFAWTLSGVCSADYLDIGSYVSNIVSQHLSLQFIIPAAFFAISLGLAFATGTSWGTFAILVPIAVAVFSDGDMLVLSVAATLAGAVCGDHISPISDTTIMSSTGASCNHIDHVSTQIPYAMFVCIFCVIGYVLSGITQNGWIGLAVSVVLMLATLTVIMKKKKA